MARGFIHQACRDWEVPEDARDSAILLTSELVTNGVLHARTEVTVTARLDDRSLVIDVEDDDVRPPVKRDHRADLLADIDELLTRDLGTDAEADERHAVMQVGPAGSIGAGRGLLLVEGLADEWGVRLETTGKAVWFRIGLSGRSSRSL